MQALRESVSLANTDKDGMLQFLNKQKLKANNYDLLQVQMSNTAYLAVNKFTLILIIIYEIFIPILQMGNYS